ncbi:MAG TPA: hypothetical protein VIM39_13080, partial [Candidatus Limnocylindrales bacterium]
PGSPRRLTRVVAQKSEMAVVDAMRNQFTRKQVALGCNDPNLAAVGKTTPSSAGFSPGRRSETRNRGR